MGVIINQKRMAYICNQNFTKQMVALKRYGGEVWKVKCDTTILDPENYIDKTFEQFKKLPIEDVMAFLRSRSY